MHNNTTFFGNVADCLLSRHDTDSLATTTTEKKGHTYTIGAKFIIGWGSIMLVDPGGSPGQRTVALIRLGKSGTIDSWVYTCLCALEKCVIVLGRVIKRVCTCVR